MMHQTPDTTIATLPKNSSEELRISLSEFRGNSLLDLRVFAAYGGSDEKRPTKKGLALRVEKIPQLIEALRLAQAEAMRLGLIEGGPR